MIKLKKKVLLKIKLRKKKLSLSMTKTLTAHLVCFPCGKERQNSKLSFIFNVWYGGATVNRWKAAFPFFILNVLIFSIEQRMKKWLNERKEEADAEFAICSFFCLRLHREGGSHRCTVDQ